jgi:hypothetical protein
MTLQSLTRAGRKLPEHPAWYCLRDISWTESSFQCSPYMSSRSGEYRQRAADAKHRPAQAKDASVKSRLEQLAADWIALAEQTERIDSQKPPLNSENKT